MIAFASARTYGDGRVDRGGVYAVTPDGSGRTLLTSDVAAAERPVWSPDRSRLAYLIDEDHDDPPGGSLWIVNADSSGRSQLFAGEAGTQAWSPDGTRTPSALTWWPDGTRLLMDVPAGTSHAGSTTVLLPREVYIASAGSSRKTFVIHGRGGFSPAWSPDGTKVAFTTDRGASTQIFVANADGTCNTQLTRSASTSPVTDHAHTPTWQPAPNAPTSPPNRCADLGLAKSSDTGIGGLRSVKEFRSPS